MPTRSSRCSPNHPAGCWWRCRAPRRAASRRCARRGACPPPGSASSTRARTRSRFRACSRCHWRSCAARPKGCWPLYCDERRASRTSSAAGVGVGPAAAEVRRRAVRRPVLLFVVDAVAGTARVVVPGPDWRRERGLRLRPGRADRQGCLPSGAAGRPLVAAVVAGAVVDEGRGGGPRAHGLRADVDPGRGLAAAVVGADGHRGADEPGLSTHAGRRGHRERAAGIGVPSAHRYRQTGGAPADSALASP